MLTRGNPDPLALIGAIRTPSYGSGISKIGMYARRTTFGATLRAQNAAAPALRCVVSTIRSALSFQRCTISVAGSPVQLHRSLKAAFFNSSRCACKSSAAFSTSISSRAAVVAGNRLLAARFTGYGTKRGDDSQQMDIGCVRTCNTWATGRLSS